jgi:two-component system OmpR family response regulator
MLCICRLLLLHEKHRTMTIKTHILVIDDDEQIRVPLAKYLQQNGLRCSLASNGKEMDQQLSGSGIDLIVLDIMLPGEDGFSICRRLQETSRVPIILLTALTDETDRIVGLELGADDYVTKPFNPRELLARIKSVLRRSQMLPPKQQKISGNVTFSGWRFNFTQKEITGSDGVAIRLSSGEHLLLVSLIEHAGMTLSRDQLLELTKGRETQLFDRSVDNQISRLRRKLEKDPKNPRIILTEWGGGYQFAAGLEWIS